MTDLEQHVNEPGRDKLVKEVKAKIDALGVTYVYYQFVSVTGRIVGKGIPARHWERLAEKGFQLVYGSTANSICGSPRKITLVTVQNHQNWSESLTQIRSANFHGTRELLEFFVDYTETVKSVIIPGAALTSDCQWKSLQTT